MNTVELMYEARIRLIFTEIQVEGVNATYADTENIIEQGIAANLSENDTNVIIGLKHAWEYLFNNARQGLSLELVSTYNELIGYGGTFINPGALRSPNSVRIGDWHPRDIDEHTFDYKWFCGADSVF